MDITTTASDVKQTMIAEPIDTFENSDIDLRQIVITLDGWCRTCDTVLETLETQIKRLNQFSLKI